MVGVVVSIRGTRGWRCRIGTLDRFFAVAVCLILLLAIGCTGSSSSGFGTNSTSGGQGGGGGSQTAAPRQYDNSYQICYPANTTSPTTPQILYTDITSGPNSGGEGNNGAYLTIFGKGFGASQGSSIVTINNVSVAAYKQWSDSKITIQPGPNVPDGTGVIVVKVGTQTSKQTDKTFTVRSGKIYFVDPNGQDSTTVAGDINHPFQTVQYAYAHADFSGAVHLVMRAGTWSDTSPDDPRYFFVFDNNMCGSTFDSVVLMAYPGDGVLIQHPSGGISAWNCQGGYTISGLTIDMQGGGGTPIGFPPCTNDPSRGEPPCKAVQNIRVVNNELYGMVSTSGGSADLEGRGHHMRYLGNRIHDNGIVNGFGASSKLYHSIYFDNNDDTGTDDIEIAYNTIWNQGGGRGIQTYNSTNRPNGTPQVTFITNVSIHHNLIHDIAMNGINISDSNHGGILIYDNIIYRTAVRAYQTGGSGGGCLRFNDPGVVAAVYNNTFTDCALDEDIDSAAIIFDQAAAGGITLVNNIIATSGGSGYFTGSPSGQVAVSSNNLWYSSGAAPSWDPNSLGGYPLFACFSRDDFSLHTGSPAIDHGSGMVSTEVVNDFDGIPRPQGSGYDIGAYEFLP